MKLERRVMRSVMECRLSDPSLAPDGTKTEEKMPRIVGHASVYNQPQNVYDMFMEEFIPGCFDDMDPSVPIVACVNHDLEDIPLARFVAGNARNTLELFSDATGLVADFLPIDSEFGRSVVKSIQRGDMDGMSITFIVLSDDCSGTLDGMMHRKILKAQLYDVTVTYYPVFPQTDVQVRNKKLDQDMSKADYQSLIEARTQAPLVPMVSEEQRLAALARRARYIEQTLRNKAP